MTPEDHATGQRAVALLVAGGRDDLDLIQELVADAAGIGHRELAFTLIGLAVTAGQILRDGVKDPAALEQLLEMLPLRYALAEGDPE